MSFDNSSFKLINKWIFINWSYRARASRTIVKESTTEVLNSSKFEKNKIQLRKSERGVTP